MVDFDIVTVNAMVVVDIKMTAVVPRIDRNIAAVAMLVEQAYLAVVYLDLTVAAASFF